MNKAVIVAVVAVLGGAVAYMLIGKPPEKIEKAEVPSEEVNAITIAKTFEKTRISTCRDTFNENSTKHYPLC